MQHRKAAALWVLGNTTRGKPEQPLSATREVGRAGNALVQRCELLRDPLRALNRRLKVFVDRQEGEVDVERRCHAVGEVVLDTQHFGRRQRSVLGNKRTDNRHVCRHRFCRHGGVRRHLLKDRHLVGGDRAVLCDEGGQGVLRRSCDATRDASLLQRTFPQYEVDRDVAEAILHDSR